MKKIMLPVLLALLAFSFTTFAQQLESFDHATADSLWQLNFEGGNAMSVYNDSTDKVEGAASVHITAKLAALHEWGTYTQYIYALPDSAQPMDWSSSDTLSVWIKVFKAPAIPANMVFRIQIGDRPTPSSDLEQYIYENATIIDAAHDWVQLKVPLKEIPSDGSIVPDSTGFVISPSSWGGFTYNDRKLNLDKIVQFQFGFITSGYTAGTNIPADSLELGLDDFERTGNKAIPAVIFNGIKSPANLEAFVWGQAAMEVAAGEGPQPKTNAVKWTMGDEWGSGWNGFGWNVHEPLFNLGGAWVTDSLSFDLKTEDGVDTLRVQFESGPLGNTDGAKGFLFKPTADNQWHHYSLPLKDFVLFDGKNNFDSSKVSVFQIMSQGNGIAGKVVYISNIWTGHPVFDVIPPDAPQNVVATAGTFNNLVTWTDVAGETGETYTIYYSKNQITDVTAAGVDVAAANIPENTQSYSHVLRAPLKDQDVTYYYAITCMDLAGNVGPVSTNSAPVTNTAKGYAVVSPTTVNFKADGDLSEWAAIKPFRMYLSDGSGTKVTNTSIDDDADCSADAYVAVDNNNLYVAFDIHDDVVYSDSTLSSWLNDCADMFIGLYDFHGATHKTLQRGAKPDYHFRFTKTQALIDNLGSAIVLRPGDNYYWEEQFPSGYRIEAKISLSVLAATGNDSLFVPKQGMRIPIDFEISDNDGNPSTSPTREGQLDYSSVANGNSYQDFSVWTHTWIGDWVTAVNDNQAAVNNYSLNQNYPNPFNPSTQISYTIQKPGLVTLKVYDILGRVVASLVNKFQNVGKYNINFNASSLASGVYFYKLDAGNYHMVKKMMLLK